MYEDNADFAIGPGQWTPAQTRFRFWKLPWQQRAQALMNVGAIPKMPEQAIPQTIESELMSRMDAATMEKLEEQIGRPSPIRIGNSSEGCGGGIHHLVDRLQADNADLRKVCEMLAAVLDAHRRFHSKVGCPGLPECFVCAAEQAMDDYSFPAKPFPNPEGRENV